MSAEPDPARPPDRLPTYTEHLADQDRERKALFARLAGGVPAWRVQLEVRLAAHDEREAAARSGYPLVPLSRFGEPADHSDGDARISLYPGRYDHAAKVAELDPAGLAEADLEALRRGYPVGIDDYFDAREGQRFAHGCRVAVARLLHPDRNNLAIDHAEPYAGALRYWRAVHELELLADTEAQARARGTELAATLVDATGRPAARLLDVQAEPDPFIYRDDDVVRLWSDYTQACGATGHPVAAVRALQRWAEAVLTAQRRAIGEHRALEARLHTHPDGIQTLSAPAELEAAAAAARRQAAGKHPDELRKLADHADYMADRVYGKNVQTDAEAKRIERLHHQATVYRQLAGDQAATADNA